MTPFRAFIVGTDTGVGKTQAACALLSLLADAGMNPAPFKPYESGVTQWDAPEDAVALREAARSNDSLDLIVPHRFEAPVAPGVAAARLGVDPPFETTLAAFRSFGDRSIIAEAAGGLRVPIDSQREVIDLVAALGMPALLVARAGLGTLNHTALSLDALRARGIPILGVVLSRSSAATDVSELDNAEWIARRQKVRVLGPVPFEENPFRRREALRLALRPLVG